MICPPLPSAGDRQVVLHRIVGKLLEQVLVGGVRRVGRDEHGVAVGRGLLRPLRAPMKPDAPGLLSTITVCLVMRVTSWPSERASWSVALPAANGTTNVICLSGYRRARKRARERENGQRTGAAGIGANRIVRSMPVSSFDPARLAQQKLLSQRVLRHEIVPQHVGQRLREHAAARPRAADSAARPARSRSAPRGNSTP